MKLELYSMLLPYSIKKEAEKLQNNRHEYPIQMYWM